MWNKQICRAGVFGSYFGNIIEEMIPHTTRQAIKLGVSRHLHNRVIFSLV